jgi:hypothetical protein
LTATLVYSTGKRRYGHPALNGVLPEPWLPLKKGQALSNNVGYGIHNGGQHNKDLNARDQAVVLTLRKRYSAAGGGRSRDRRERSTQRQSEWGSGAAGVPSGLTTSVDPSTVFDPWQDPSASTSTAHAPQLRQTNRSHTLAHRLSYDPASGVIILPDEAAWLESDDSDVVDSDGEDYGTELERSVSSLAPGGDGEELGVAHVLSGSPERSSVAGTSNQGQGTNVTQARGSGVSTPTRTSRYGTYFHHPEKRKQTIPGAFPFR